MTTQAKKKPAPAEPTPTLSVRSVPLAALVKDPGNARLHGPVNLEAIRASLDRFGQAEPLVVQRGTLRIIAGHGRLEAMKALGWARCDVVEIDVTEKDAATLGVILNRSAEMATWDEAALAKIIADVQASGGLDVIGYSKEEIDALFASVEAAERGPIEDPGELEPLAEAVSARGDLWTLGAHRILCGDSTCAEDVKRLMNGERAGLMNTDPPYGVAYANEDRPHPGVAKPRTAKTQVANDHLHDAELQRFLEAAFGAASEHALKPNAAWYLWHAHLTQGFFAAAAAAAAANVVLSRQIIWVKPVLLLTRGQYHWKHEPCFSGWVKGNQPPDYGRGDGERNQTTVWEIGQVTHAERKEFNHSTPKPVGLFEVPITKHLRPGEVCYEPFSGSGPQLIAAEGLGRRCYAMELEPRFVDVAIRRWQGATGRAATLDGTTRTFDEVSAERLASAL